MNALLVTGNQKGRVVAAMERAVAAALGAGTAVRTLQVTSGSSTVRSRLGHCDVAILDIRYLPHKISTSLLEAADVPVFVTKSSPNRLQEELRTWAAQHDLRPTPSVTVDASVPSVQQDFYHREEQSMTSSAPTAKAKAKRTYDGTSYRRRKPSDALMSYLDDRRAEIEVVDDVITLARKFKVSESTLYSYMRHRNIPLPSERAKAMLAAPAGEASVGTQLLVDTMLQLTATMERLIAAMKGGKS